MSRDVAEYLAPAAEPTRTALQRMADETEEQRWKQALFMIREAFCDPDFQVADLKRALGGGAWLFAACRRHTGMTPARLIRECRMEVASRLLRDSLLPITDVAALVGIDNPLTLQRLCRDWCGRTPSELRGHVRKVRPHSLELGNDVMTWWYWRRLVRDELTSAERQRIRTFIDLYGGARP